MLHQNICKNVHSHTIHNRKYLDPLKCSLTLEWINSLRHFNKIKFYTEMSDWLIILCSRNICWIKCHEWVPYYFISYKLSSKTKNVIYKVMYHDSSYFRIGNSDFNGDQRVLCESDNILKFCAGYLSVFSL